MYDGPLLQERLTMTSSLASDLGVPLPDPIALHMAVVARDFAPRPPSGRPWDPAIDAPPIPGKFVRANPFLSPPHTTIHLLEPISAYARQLNKRPRNLSNTLSAYAHRIYVLEEQAASEGYYLNSGSRVTFFVFFKSNPLIQLGRLFLLENGNLRAVWKDDEGSHIGLQFLENGLIQYVLFKRRHVDLPVSRAYGRDTPLGVLEQISALELDQVLYR